MSHNALTIDLEEYFQVSNFDGVIARSSWDAQPSRVEQQTEQLLELFAERGVHATFFALGWVAQRRPALLRRIAEQGHEIACHGYGHELVYEIGPERFRADLRRARAAIEAAVGCAVRGYRAPSYSITRDSLWALDILVEEGFAYDSSIFPVRHPRYGIPGFPAGPARLALAGGAELTEFPLSTLALGPLRVPIAGGAYLRFLPAPFFRWGMGRLVRSGEPAVLYLHPWEVDAEQPRQRVSRRVQLNHYHACGAPTLARLRALLERFEFGTMGALLDELERDGKLPLRPLAVTLAAEAA